MSADKLLGRNENDNKLEVSAKLLETELLETELLETELLETELLETE